MAVLLRLLLHLYPASFRSEYGSELRRLYADRQAGASGLWERFGLAWEAVRDLAGSAAGAHLDLLRHDLRQAVRSLRRAPGFALPAITVTALGIGAATAVFSLADQVLLRPLPFPDGERLVRLWERLPQYGRMEPSPANFRDWKRMSQSFEGMAAYNPVSVSHVGDGPPEQLAAVRVTSDLLPLLGVPPLLGRAFLPDDDRAGAPGTVLLSHGLWQRGFGGRRDVLGNTVRLDGERYTVVGVMPPSFDFPNRATDLWLPMRFEEVHFEDRDDNYLSVLARLAPGVGLAEARTELAVIAAQLERAYPDSDAHTGITIQRLRDQVSPRARLLLAALAGAATCVLLIACTNLANLLLARALGRRRELAVRAALGAGRERLLRQLITESLALAAVGGICGVLVASAAVPLLEALVPTSLPVSEATALHPRVLLFAALMTTLSGLAFGALPALRVCRRGDFGALREDDRAGSGGGRRLRTALVLAQMIVSVVLLVSAGLLVRALWRIQAVDPGFRTEGVVALRAPLAFPKYAATERRAAFYDRVLSQVRVLPGVRAAAFASFLPIDMGGGIWPVEVPGAEPAPDDGRPTASLRFVTPGFFEALDIPRLAGRDVRSEDGPEDPWVAVVSESFARRHWPGRNPLGRRFTFAFFERTVVGVVADIRVRGLERPSEPQVYLPYRQATDGGVPFYAPRELVVRTDAEVEPVVLAARAILAQADPELPVAEVRTLGDVVAAEMAPRRTQLAVLAAFAALALLLAGVGVHGLLAFAVSRRTREIGLRVALGARAREVLGMVLGEGLTLAAAGGVAGAVLALASGRALEALLAGVRPADPAAFLGSVVLVALTALTGCLAPALRALRIDPNTALRAD